MVLGNRHEYSTHPSIQSHYFINRNAEIASNFLIGVKSFDSLVGYLAPHVAVTQGMHSWGQNKTVLLEIFLKRI